MKRLGIVFCSLFVALMLFLPVSSGECYVTLKHQDVPFVFGKLRLPEDMTIVEFDLASFLRKMEEDKDFQRELTLMSGHEQYKNLAKYLEYLKKQEVKEVVESLRFYQAGLYDGKSYRTVWLFTMTQNQVLNDFYGDFFKGKLTDEKKFALENKLNKLVKKVTDEYTLKEGESFDYSQVKKMTSKNQFDKPVFELLDISTPEYSTVKGKHAVVMEYRLAGQMMGSFAAVYVKDYSFGYKNKPACFGFFSLDSEREFWQEIFDRAVLDEDKTGKKA